jgi:hypothetical protein
MPTEIDGRLISVALAQLTSPPDVKKDIAIVARCMDAGTLVMSAGLNARRSLVGRLTLPIGAGGFRMFRAGGNPRRISWRG